MQKDGAPKKQIGCRGVRAAGVWGGATTGHERANNPSSAGVAWPACCEVMGCWAKISPAKVWIRQRLDVMGEVGWAMLG
jgi:hypothetical protein